MKESNDNSLYYAAVITSLLAVLLCVSLLSGFLPTHINYYNSYSLQAQSWLNGRLDLGRNYSWLELAIYNGKYYVSFPPFPSFVMIPFVLIFGTDTPDHFIIIFFSMVSAIYAFKLSELYLNDKNKSFFISMFLCAASNFIIVSIAGGVWFMAQNMAFAFTLAAFYYASTGYKAHFYLSLLFIACAMGCRPFQAVYVLLIFYLLYRRLKDDNGFNYIYFIKKALDYSIPAILLGCIYMFLNFARFGNIFEFGHNYLPEFLESPNGQFSISYIWDNVQSLFRLPAFSDNGMKFPLHNGVAVWIVFPILISYIVYFVNNFIVNDDTKNKKDIFYIFIFISIIIHILLLCAHKTMGGFHFGHRYIIDCMPAVAFGLILLLRDKGSHKGIILNFPLFLWGVAVNVYGGILFFPKY